MTSTPTSLRLFAVLGFMVGVGFMVMAGLGWRVPPGDGMARTSLTLVANNTGTLAMAPAGAFLTDADISRAPARGRLSPLNQTGSPLWVRLRVRPSSADLGRRLTVTARADGVSVYEGDLAGLGRWTAQRFPIAAGQRTLLEFDVAATPGAEREIQGRAEQLEVQFGTRPVRT